MRSCASRPTGLSTKAVTIAVSRPKQRFSPRATLYSPPPSKTWNVRVVWMRPSPGSRRSITSPRLTRSHRQADLALTLSSGTTHSFSRLDRPRPRGFLADEAHVALGADREHVRRVRLDRDQGRRVDGVAVQLHRALAHQAHGLTTGRRQ